MHIHASGRVAHGIGGGQASVDNVAFAPEGGVGGWLDSGPVTAVLFANGSDGWFPSTYDPATKFVRRVPGATADLCMAAGSTWAVHGAWGFRLSDGFIALKAGLLALGADGTAIYKPDYHSNGPCVGRLADGSEFPVSAGVVYAPQVLGPRQVLFTAGPDKGITTIGGLPPVRTVPGNVYGPRAAFAGGQWWVTYWSDTQGIVLHPFGSFEGFSILPKGDGWQSIAAISADTIRVIVSLHEGEQPGDLWGYDINVVTKAVTKWAHSVTPPFVPKAVVDCRTINAPVPVAPLAPNVPSLPFLGFWHADATAIGNLAIGAPTYTAPHHTCVIAEVQHIDAIPTDRRVGVLVYLTGDDATIVPQIEQGIRDATTRGLPCFIYDDRRYGRFGLIQRTCGTAKWVWMPQITIQPGEDPAAFVAEMIRLVKTFNGHPILPSIRANTSVNGQGVDVVPEPVVISVFNELITQDALNLPGFLGPMFFAWKRADGAGLNPAGQPFRPRVHAAVSLWAKTAQTVTHAPTWVRSFMGVPTMTLDAAVLATVQRYAAFEPIPRGDGSDAWIESALRQGWTKRMAEQVAFSHGAKWGRKAQSASHPVSKEALALNDGGLHVWDLLVGASSGNPTLATNPTYHFVPGQLFIPVTPVDHLGAIVPPTNRPTIATPLWGVDSFDLGVRVQEGDRRWIDQVLAPHGLIGRTVCASKFRTPRTLYTGLVQTDLACAALRAAKARSQFVLLCDTAEYGLSRRDALAQVVALNAIFLRYPEVVAGLQIGNENSHGVEQPYMSDPGFLAEADALIDPRFPVAWGAGHGGEGVSMAGGSYLVHHTDRALSPAANGLIMAEAQTLAKRPVVDDEPLGIAEVGRTAGRQRTDNPAFAQQLVAVVQAQKLGGLTLHIDAGMTANVDELGPVQRAALAFMPKPVPVPPIVLHPILDVPLTPDYPILYAFFIANGDAILAEAAAWYLRSTGRVPARSDVWHGTWRALKEGSWWGTLRGAFEETWPGGAPR